MKHFFGILIAFFSIVLIAILILKVWNINVIGWADMLRSGITSALLALAVIILLFVRFLFFRRSNHSSEKINRF